jgi:alkylation response protein AidB-like acyl-CoA dehydrogenase
MPDTGAGAYALAARALNEIIMFAHSHKLTKQQYVMFCLADMMTHVEVGISMARKAQGLIEKGSPEAKKIVIMSRVFANEVADLVARNAMKILMGPGLFDKQTVSEVMRKMNHERLAESYSGLIQDMDAVADILFDRA